MVSISDPNLFIAGGISPSTAYKTINYILLIYINIGYIAATGDWGSRPTEGTNLSGPRRSFFRGPAHVPAGLDWPRGRCTFVGRSPPPLSVVGRDGLAIGRFGRFPEPPAVILYLRPPPPSTIAITPPVNNRDHPPPVNNRDNPPVNNRDHPPPPPASEVGPVSPVPRAEFGSQSSPAVPFMGINGRLPMLILC